MCESNVYLLKGASEELLMEKVDRLIPGEDETIFLENIFGERRLIKARIKEMELVHHRIILTEASTSNASSAQGEWWLEPVTNHGHFHVGEEVRMKLCWGYNMQPADAPASQPEVFILKEGQIQKVAATAVDDQLFVNLGESADGIISMYAHAMATDNEYYAKMVLEIGHHHHHDLEPTGIPLEIMPVGYQHAHVGENYEVMVLYQGKPLPEAEVRATYSGNTKSTYPVRVHTDKEGQARIFLAARGNYLLSCQHENIISTYTLIKNY